MINSDNATKAHLNVEDPVVCRGQVAEAFARCHVPHDRAVVLAAAQQQRRVSRAPRQRQHALLVSAQEPLRRTAKVAPPEDEATRPVSAPKLENLGAFVDSYRAFRRSHTSSVGS